MPKSNCSSEAITQSSTNSLLSLPAQEEKTELMPSLCGFDKFKYNIEFLESFLKKGAAHSIFTYPSASGKTRNSAITKNLLTLKDFFSSQVKDEATGDLFKEMLSRYPKYIQFRGKYPVILLNLADLVWEKDGFFPAFGKKISEIYQQFSNIKSVLQPILAEQFDCYVSGEFMNESVSLEIRLQRSLKALAIMIEKYYGTKPIILIDGYEIVSSFNKAQLEFIQLFFEISLKSDAEIGQTVVMGSAIEMNMRTLFPNNCKYYFMNDDDCTFNFETNDDVYAQWFLNTPLESPQNTRSTQVANEDSSERTSYRVRKHFVSTTQTSREQERAVIAAITGTSLCKIM